MAELGIIPRKATLEATSGSDTDPIDVHFNPASLQYTVTNTLREEGRGGTKKQYITQSSGKLTIDLIFDTTNNGDDVRDTTQRIARFMDPDTPASPNSRRQTAKVVKFKWGVYTFTGMVESYKETIDFFSSDGVPLRSSVNLTLVKQSEAFDGPPPGSGGFNSNPNLNPDNLDVVDVPEGPDSSPSAAASQAGSPEGAREVAAANGVESLRFGAAGGLSVSGSISLTGPVAFASGSAGLSAGIGIGAGAGIGVSAGAGGGVSAGAGFGVSAAAGVGVSAGSSAGFSASASAGTGAFAGGGAVFGSSAAAGKSFSEGAFAGLAVRTTSSRSASFDTSRLLPRTSVRNSTGPGASFQLGGAAATRTSSSLRADVGAGASLTTRLRFEES